MFVNFNRIFIKWFFKNIWYMIVSAWVSISNCNPEYRCILKHLKENRELAQPETTSSTSAPPAEGAETLTFRQINHHLLHHLTASTATSSSTTTSGDDERDGSEDDEDELLDDLDPLAGARVETGHVTTTNLMDDPLILESLSAEACQDMSALAAGYKLRDSRIIEIAGGRELYSASRSKASRGGGGNSAGGSGKPKPGVWELRARCPLRRQHVCTAPCTQWSISLVNRSSS